VLSISGLVCMPGIVNDKNKSPGWPGFAYSSFQANSNRCRDRSGTPRR
jgi:hypothetical protein